MVKVNGSEIVINSLQHEDQCGAVLCLSADDSVLDGYPLCAPNSAPDLDHIAQMNQIKAQNKVNFVAVTVLALCVLLLLFAAVIGWLHKCHKTEVQKIRREEVDELKEQIIELQTIKHTPVKKKEPSPDMLAELDNTE